MERADAVELEFRESMIHRIEQGYILPKQIESVYDVEKIKAKLKSFPLVLVSTMDYNVKEFAVRIKENISVKSSNSYQNNFELLIKDLEEWKKKDIG